jgi:drug/metabolite transporter (DMT)-like permease
VTISDRSWFSVAQAFSAIALISLVPIWVTAVSADAIVIGCIRLLIACTGVGLWFFAFRRIPVLTRRQWGGVALIGLLFGAHWLTYFISIKLSTPSIGAIGLSSYGIHLTLLSWWHYKGKPSKSVWLALALAIIGNFVVTSGFGSDGGVMLGFLIGVLSGLFYAVVPLLHKHFSEISAEFRTLCQFGFALTLFIFLAPLGDWNFPTSDWPYLLALGVVCTLIGHALWVRASTSLHTELTSCIFYLGLPCTIFFEWFLMSTSLSPGSLSPSTLVGAALIVIANVMTIFGGRKHMLK